MRQALGWLTSSCAIVALIVGVVPAEARADGDPASDVLATQPAFVPWDAGVPAHQASELGSVLEAAARSGFPVRVALIYSAADLGTVTALWLRPVEYAQFLGEELSLVYHGRVLVAMPDGLGLSLEGRPLALPSGSTRAAGGGLAGEATVTVRQLAAASRHRIAPLSTAPVPLPARKAAHVPAAALAFVIGLVLIAVAWGVSLHVRPPRGRLRRLFSD